MKTVTGALVLAASVAGAADYSAETLKTDGLEIVRLYDRRHDVEVRIAPALGNNAYRMAVRGTNILWWPHTSTAEWQKKPGFSGNPLLAPWANRIDGDVYAANGKRYVLNSHLGNVRRDSHGNPIHGLLVHAPWEVKTLRADDGGAVLVSRLEFWRRPDWMAQFPFAHTLEVTHRLADGVLEIETTIENLSSEAMPVSFGYHPYYQVTDAPRDEWTIHLPARTRVRMDERLIPTGETDPNTLADPLSLAGVKLDDGFTDLTRGADGYAVFWLAGRKQRVVVEFGPAYPVALVYAPPGGGYVCFEPMSAVTNAFNLAPASRLAPPTIPPGESWKATFRIRTEGF